MNERFLCRSPALPGITDPFRRRPEGPILQPKTNHRRPKDSVITAPRHVSIKVSDSRPLRSSPFEDHYAPMLHGSLALWRNVP